VVGVPLIDSVLAGVQHARRLAQQEVLQPTRVFEFAWSHVSDALAATGAEPPTE
jgi:hypothetical protein